MYKKGIYKILANEPLTASVWRMVLEGDTEWIVRPGQFVNIALEGRYLRRPISVCDCDARTLTLIYKVVGGGTEQMSRMAAGAELDLLTGLGNGFDTSNDARRPLLVGGGVGVPPLYKLAKALLAEGKPVSVVLGFNTADEIFYNPCHEYTKGLLRSIPSASNVGEKLEPIHGTPIDLLNMPAGCPFAPRCEAAMKICLRERAERMRINEDHLASCWMNVKKGLEDGSIELAEDKDAERKDGADA